MSHFVSDDSESAREVKEEPTDHVVNIDSSDEFTSSPPSSPTVVEAEPSLHVAKSEQSSPSRKRSHEEMSYADTKEDAGITVDQNDPGTSNSGLVQKDNAPSPTQMSNTNAHSMPPPATPASNMPPPKMVSAKPKTTGHSSQEGQSDGGQIVAKLDEQPNGCKSNQEDSSSDKTEADDPPLADDPADVLEAFDWADLQQRYHDRMGALNDSEGAILRDFERLCSVSPATQLKPAC